MASSGKQGEMSEISLEKCQRVHRSSGVEKVVSQQDSLKGSVIALGLKSAKSLGSFVGLTENDSKPLSLWKETWMKRVKSGNVGISAKVSPSDTSCEPIEQIQETLSQLGRVETSLRSNELPSSLEDLTFLEEIHNDLNNGCVQARDVIKDPLTCEAIDYDDDQHDEDTREIENLIKELCCEPPETCDFVSCSRLNKSDTLSDVATRRRGKYNPKCESNITVTPESGSIQSFESLEEDLKKVEVCVESDKKTSSLHVYGKEALHHYRVFRLIERRKQRRKTKDKRKKTVEKLQWQLQTLDQLMEIGKEYFFNPRGEAAEKWRDFQKNFKEKCNCQLPVEDQLGKLPVFFPYFTFFIIIVQIITFIVVCSLGGVTTVGFEPQIIVQENIKTFLGLETVHKLVVPNPWIGPSSAPFIGLGALYAPCMREDYNINLKLVQQNYSLEETLGCCEIFIRNTAGTTTKNECDELTNGAGQWNGGVVCSERASGNNSIDHNMKPCCVGIKGYCYMISHHHCVFLGGVYHLKGPQHCSQVNCLSQVCGMGGLSFSDERPWMSRSPNQWWRIPLSLIYNQGIFQLLIVCTGHLLLTRVTEPIAGWLRVAIIYIIAGVIGVLGGAVFSPYEPHFGTVGALFGMVGVTVVECLQSWKLVKKPVREFFKLLAIISVSFICGTLPFLSNFQLLFSLLAGVITAVMILPYVTFGRWNQRRRRVLVGLSVPLLKMLFLFILYLFYKVQTLNDCQSCNNFECIPYTSQFCLTGYS